MIIAWPQRPAGQYVKVTDADTGMDISPKILGVTVHVDVRGTIQTDLLMLTDLDGNPSDRAVLYPDESGYCKGTFRCRVVEMRILENT